MSAIVVYRDLDTKSANIFNNTCTIDYTPASTGMDVDELIISLSLYVAISAVIAMLTDKVKAATLLHGIHYESL